VVLFVLVSDPPTRRYLDPATGNLVVEGEGVECV
jgi:hypothetical protein